jgi:two-component system, LytTR family, sensor kinase
MISTFIILSGFFLLILFKVYSIIPYFNVSFDQEAYLWSYYTLGIVNIFLTFLMESIARYERWNQNQKETFKLKEVYQKSRFLGLQSQVSPHFLFNSLNSLSSLISEDEEKAEHFLNEMTKVYRYMLRTETDNLVSLQTELNFIKSYLYLLQERFGKGLQVHIDIPENYMEKFIAPLTLQTIIENTFNHNSITKSNPLIIDISGIDDKIKVSNTVQPKNISDEIDFEAGLDNLLNKYKLLSKEGLIVEETKIERTIYLPLFLAEKEILT